MNQIPQFDPWLAGLIGAAVAASCAIWTGLLGRMLRGTPCLPFQPRRPVPWGIGGGALAAVMVLLPLAGAATGGNQAIAEDATALQLLDRVALATLQAFLFTLVVFVVVARASGARRTDLGLPGRVDALGSDIKVGVVAWLAALVPVYGLQATLVHFFGQESQHPLIEMIVRESEPALFLAAFVAAVIIAPLCEEVAFRLLLQGWLEKWEDSLVRPRPLSSPHVENPPLEHSQPTPGASEPGTSAPPQSGNNPYESPTATEGESEPAHPRATAAGTDVVAMPPARGAAGLPYGWMPITVSSLMFGVAHFGHGPDPIALFVLALILGYIYQRTHRIVPCIVTHMLFNAFSLLALAILMR